MAVDLISALKSWLSSLTDLSLVSFTYNLFQVNLWCDECIVLLKENKQQLFCPSYLTECQGEMVCVCRNVVPPWRCEHICYFLVEFFFFLPSGNSVIWTVCMIVCEIVLRLCALYRNSWVHVTADCCWSLMTDVSWPSAEKHPLAVHLCGFLVLLW